VSGITEYSSADKQVSPGFPGAPLGMPQVKCGGDARFGANVRSSKNGSIIGQTNDALLRRKVGEQCRG
jgi:hypothetical protein